jgi:hypothetical protein
MKTLLLIPFSILALASTSTSALAIAERFCPNEKTITFNKLSRIDGSLGEGTCKQRYNKELVTKIPSDSINNPLKRCTYKGHDILVISIDDSVSDGIFIIRNTYEIIFPWDKTKTPVKIKVIATGLVGSREASGVFSDDTCRGTIKIRQATKTIP